MDSGTAHDLLMQVVDAAGILVGSTAFAIAVVLTSVVALLLVWDR